MKLSKLIARYLSFWIVLGFALLVVGVAINWNLFFVAFWYVVGFASATILIFLNPIWLVWNGVFKFISTVNQSIESKLEKIDRVVERLKEDD